MSVHNEPLTRRSSVWNAVTALSIGVICAAAFWIWSSSPERPAGPRLTTRTPAQKPPLPLETLSLEGAAVRGRQDAPVALILFTDFQCPFCGTVAREILPQLEQRYVSTGRMLLAVRHLPLEKIHPFALPAAVAAECAGEQGSFWDMHDELFFSQRQLDAGSLTRRSQVLGLKQDQFSACLSGPMTAKVQKDLALAGVLRISSTPTFLLGPLQNDGRVKVAERLSGSLPFERLERAVESILNPSSAERVQTREPQADGR
ncbi:MAG: thioredoxin domain-containing protein [Vicinamibacterales bacterium]